MMYAKGNLVWLLLGLFAVMLFFSLSDLGSLGNHVHFFRTRQQEAKNVRGVTWKKRKRQNQKGGGGSNLEERRAMASELPPW